MSYRQACFFIILLTFLQIYHSKIPPPGKLVKTRHIWRNDLQTESTGSRRSELVGDSCSRCERVDSSTSNWVELCRYKRAFRWCRQDWCGSVVWMYDAVDSYCPPVVRSGVSVEPRMQTLESSVHIVARHNFASPTYLNDESRIRRQTSNARRNPDRVWLQWFTV